MREQVAAFPALKTIVSNSESAGTYTALVFERLMAAHWPHIEVRSTMVAIAMPPGQFPTSNGQAGETEIHTRGSRFSVVHYTKDQLSRVDENQAEQLLTFLRGMGIQAFIVTNAQLHNDRIFGNRRHSYGPFVNDFMKAGTGCHELHNIATTTGLSSKQDKLDWLVQFLTLHLHLLNNAWGFLHDLASRWEAHPTWIEVWQLGEGEVEAILQDTNNGLPNQGRLTQEVLKDILNIVMALEPIKQALLFQVVIPFYANRVYATIAT